VDAPFDLAMTDAVATSRDGRHLNYTQHGAGPGLVLVHGAMQTARNLERLAEALASSYRVILYDRRGRGRNAAIRKEDWSDRLQRETEDLSAVVTTSDARFVFGLSSGAILTMSAALTTRAIEKVVLYEPPLAIGRVDPGGFGEDFLMALARQRFGRAMAIIVKGTGDRELLTHVPRPLLSLLFGLAIRLRAPAPNGAPLRELLSSVPADIAIQRAGSATIPPFARFETPTLLLGGSRSHRQLTDVLDCIEHELPNVRRGLIQDSGHTAADNEGKPEEVAKFIAGFLR
jgi:pimeloyl-ACP methyl ester carboxylesterase